MRYVINISGSPTVLKLIICHVCTCRCHMIVITQIKRKGKKTVIIFWGKISTLLCIFKFAQECVGLKNQIRPLHFFFVHRFTLHHLETYTLHSISVMWDFSISSSLSPHGGGNVQHSEACFTLFSQLPYYIVHLQSDIRLQLITPV